MELSHGMFLPNRIHVRRRASGDGIALHALLGRDAPSIVDAVCSNVKG